MLTTCSAAAPAWSGAHHAAAAVAPDTALHDPARDVTPSGTPHCKNAGTNVHGELRNARSNPADHRAASQNLRTQALGAGPRAANPRQLTHPATPRTVHAPARDTADSVPADVLGLSRSPDTAGSPANDANAAPLVDTLHCNNAFADAADRTAVHSPSADIAAAGVDNPLAAPGCAQQNDFGPREPVTPAVQVSKRSVNFASRRFLHLAPHRLSFPVTLRPAPIPRPTAHAVARATARFCHASKALLTPFRHNTMNSSRNSIVSLFHI